MATNHASTVPRPVEPPTADEVYQAMTPSEPYVVSDLLAYFETQGVDTNKGTIRNRLEYLAQEGRVRRKKHESGAVTYRRLY